jgi:hypothetical protein
MGSHFNSHKLGVLKTKEISPLPRGNTRLVGRISLSPISHSHHATCPHPISFPSFLFFSSFSLSPPRTNLNLPLSRSPFLFFFSLLLPHPEAEPGIYPSRDEIRIIKYNDKINFYSHYILHL